MFDTTIAHTPELLSRANDLIQKCKLESSTTDHLLGQFRGLSTAAGWHNFDDIPTLVGLEGSFLWLENPLIPGQIQFQFDAGQVGSSGTYRITSFTGALIEQGTFNSVPNNPAIGWAFIVLQPQNMAPARPFIVQGMLTDATWKIHVLLLSKVVGNDILPPFPAVRIS